MPRGAYDVQATNFCASSRVFTIGQISACAPASRLFMMMPGSSQGTRTMGSVSVVEMACSMVTILW